jgi:hypothetical protein
MQIIEKPWGKEEILEINAKYMFKRLTMHKGTSAACNCITVNAKPFTSCTRKNYEFIQRKD